MVQRDPLITPIPISLNAEGLKVEKDIDLKTTQLKVAMSVKIYRDQKKLIRVLTAQGDEN